MTAKLLVTTFALLFVSGCSIASVLPVHVEEPDRPGAEMEIAAIDRDLARKIVDETLRRELFVRNEEFEDPDRGDRSYVLDRPELDLWISAHVVPTERGLRIDLVESRHRPSEDARRLAETLRAALSMRFGEDRVSW